MSDCEHWEYHVLEGKTTYARDDGRGSSAGWVEPIDPQTLDDYGAERWEVVSASWKDLKLFAALMKRRVLTS